MAPTGIANGIGIGPFGGRAPFLPTDIDGCVLWLRADLGITEAGSGVSVWADQSGNGNDFVQGTDSARPPYTASDPDFNGHPSLSFDGSADHLVIDTLGSLSSASANHSLFAVLKSDTTTASGRMVLEHSQNGGLAGDIRVGRYWTNTSNSGRHGFFTGGAGVDIVASAPDTATQLLEWEQDADDDELRVYENGVLSGVAAPVVERAINSDNACTIGCLFTAAGSFFDGRIAELVYLDHSPTTEERALLGAYFARYGI
jgi:hypothetical protein